MFEVSGYSMSRFDLRIFCFQRAELAVTDKGWMFSQENLQFTRWLSANRKNAQIQLTLAQTSKNIRSKTCLCLPTLHPFENMLQPLLFFCLKVAAWQICKYRALSHAHTQRCNRWLAVSSCSCSFLQPKITSLPGRWHVTPTIHQKQCEVVAARRLLRMKKLTQWRPRSLPQNAARLVTGVLSPGCVGSPESYLRLHSDSDC